MKCVDLIQYIVWFATTNGHCLTNNRLVKFMYLADLFNARTKNGETMTGLPWQFINYGPYCSDVATAIEEATKRNVICSKTYQSCFAGSKEYDLYWCNEDDAQDIEDIIPFGVLGQLQEAIKKFADDTPQLLDFVYFQTEPMQGVKKYDYLDFSSAKKSYYKKEIKFKKLSPDSINSIRKNIKGIARQVEKDRTEMFKEERRVSKYKDKLYYNVIEKLEGDPLETGLTGTARIQMNEHPSSI